MNNWPLNRRLLFISLAPLLLVTVVLSSYYMVRGIENLRRQINDQGQLLALQLAPASEYGVISANVRFLDRMLKNTLQNESIVSVTIYDQDMDLLAVVERQPYAAPYYYLIFEYLFELLSDVGSTNRFIEPIVTEVLDIEDIAAGLERPKEEIIGYVDVEVSLSISAFRQFTSVLSGFFISVAVLIFVFLFSMRTGREITLSIENMARTVSRIQDGDLSARSVSSLGAELKSLSVGINAMAENISRSEEELIEKVELATTELKRKNEALEYAERDAIAASEAKTVFLANMSHEIRTPMNGILGFTEVMLKTPLDTQQRHYVETIRGASENLLLLINEILDFSRIESGKMPLEFIDAELNPIIGDLFSLYSSAAYNKGIELLFFIDPELPSQAKLDPKLFKQVMTNLISNAIKFTERGNVQVYLAYSKNKQRLTVQVKDTGVGLKTERIQNLFNEFEQGDNSTARKFGGSGLGLAITKKIVELFGGNIEAYNYDHGACFEFNIPLLEIAPAPQAIGGLSIALVSPNSLVQKSYETIFSRYGYEVTTAHSLEELPAGDYQATLYLMEPCDLHYRIQGNVSTIAFVSSTDPNELAAVKDWGFGRVINKTIEPFELYSALQDQSYIPSSTIEYETTSDETHHLSGLHVLVVDDNHVNLSLMDTYLNDLGAEVLMCDNGDRAVQVVQGNHIDIIFLDIHMPGMDGFETARTIRGLGYSRKMFPIIGLSADGVGNVRERAMEAGMDDYLLKPVSQKRLMETMELFLGPRFQPPEEATTEPAYNSAPVMQAANTTETEPAPTQDNEAQLKQELTEMLIVELPNMMEELDQAAQINDLDKLFQIAHKIHGASVYCDIPDVESASVGLERACRGGDLPQVPQMLQQLKKEVNALLSSYYL